MIEGRWLDLDNELDSDPISGGQRWKSRNSVSISEFCEEEKTSRYDFYRDSALFLAAPHISRVNRECGTSNMREESYNRRGK